MNPQDKNKQITPEIREYLQALIIEKGIENLPPEMLGQLMFDLYDRLEDYMMANVALALPRDKFNEFEDLMETETDGREVEKYLRRNASLKKVVDETLIEFRQIFLG